MALLGIDLGTSAVKVLVISDDGVVLGSHTTGYPLAAPRPHWSEQNPEDWWTGTADAIRGALASASVTGAEIRGIGLSGQMHGLTLLDKHNKILRPAILWNDQRTAPQVQQMIDTVGGKRGVRKLLTNFPSTSYTAPKILWVREHEPKIYSKIHKILLPKDYVRFRLSGEYATEVTDATGVALLDIKKRQWSDKVLALFDIPKDLLPRVEESHVVSAMVSAAGAAATGLAAGTPIVGGAGDQAAAGVGAGAVRSGIVCVTFGTAGVLFASMDDYNVVEGGLETFCHALPDKWHYMGVMLSAGGSLRWHRDNIAMGDPNLMQPRAGVADPYDAMMDAAMAVPAGADGLFFLPYLSGERTPHQNPRARGAFIGLTLHHTNHHMTRAAVEGIAYGLRDALELVRNSGIKASEVRMVGGAAKSAIWRQLLADVFDTEITLLNITEGGAYGVALLAGVGTGLWGNTVQACDATLKVTMRVTPTRKKTLRAQYDQTYAAWRALYPALKGTFK